MEMSTSVEGSPTLSSEQVQFLLQKLSSDEQKELGNMLKTCTTEMTFTRGLPFAAAVVGSLYFARQRLPTVLHFGPKKWPFYVVVGIGALTSANLLSMTTCTQRIQPHLNSLWQKYSSEDSASTMNYDDLRRRNRQGIGFSGTGHAPAMRPPEAVKDSQISLAERAENQRFTDSSTRRQNYDQYQSQQQPSSIAVGGYSGDLQRGDSQSNLSAFNYDQPSYISGTPVGAPKKTQYGDEGFS
ncbi:unnamed protein product [Anisakis simplex]|uniref:OCIA domain-containing protein n=1 Tax=Anisakis simplex TaxID=6269 RepID=A0A0M3JQW3_ANISI|nr:unnamed protein product [Anisakis simplex]